MKRSKGNGEILLLAIIHQLNGMGCSFKHVIVSVVTNSSKDDSSSAALHRRKLKENVGRWLNYGANFGSTFHLRQEFVQYIISCHF